MKTLISTFFLLCVLSGCQQASVVLEPDAFDITQELNGARSGNEAALEHIAQNRLSLIAYGRPSHSLLKYTEIIQERYSVGFKGGCIPVETEAYVEEYNRVMKEEIAKRFGENALEKAWAEAQI